MFRHACASWLGQMQGVEALTIRDLLGHSSVTMTDRYMHGDQADMHDAVRKLETLRSHSGHTDWESIYVTVSTRRQVVLVIHTLSSPG